MGTERTFTNCPSRETLNSIESVIPSLIYADNTAYADVDVFLQMKCNCVCEEMQ